MKDDPTIARIRQRRHEISACHGHDPFRLVEYYRELEAQYSREHVQSLEDDSVNREGNEKGEQAETTTA